METPLYNLLSFFVQLITLGVVFWAATSALKQFRAARRNTWVQGFRYFTEILQSEDNIKARGKAFELRDLKKPYHSYTEEEKAVLDKVCRSFDLVGMMAQWGMIPKEVVIDSWYDTISRLWPICEPRVKERREILNVMEFWDDFEWLYKEAVAFNFNRKQELKKIKSIQSLE